MIYDSILGTIGRTPIVRINRLAPQHVTMYVKCEFFNPICSVKDRTAVTYLGQVHGVMAALKHMRPRNRGSIVCVGSALAYRSVPLQSVYCGAKFGGTAAPLSCRTRQGLKAASRHVFR
jgi:NAD(P)-dependent dehydrogenase (short-subunit alcohol dehydrogenase family)